MIYIIHMSIDRTSNPTIQYFETVAKIRNATRVAAMKEPASVMLTL